jgi:hypothetical protein
MRSRTWLAGIAGAAALGFVALPAQAAPAGAPAALQGALVQPTDLQQATWDGYRYRHRHHYGPSYGYRDRHYRPGFRYYYGPRYHRHRHHHHRHHRHW